ncbi:MAG: DUF1667 domain-containing protein [Clostridia bacterium]|nr:DUF1667 domain-containing protein [Clostridia bacterium]
MTENKELICINCPMGCRLNVTIEDGSVTEVTGNTCPRGREYALKEAVDPMRILTSTVKIEGAVHRVLPVISDGEIPLRQMFEAMAEIKKIDVRAPIKEGDIVLHDILGSGVNIIASRTMDRVD